MYRRLVRSYEFIQIYDAYRPNRDGMRGRVLDDEVGERAVTLELDERVRLGDTAACNSSVNAGVDLRTRVRTSALTVPVQVTVTFEAVAVAVEGHVLRNE